MMKKILPALMLLLSLTAAAQNQTSKIFHGLAEMRIHTRLE